MKLNLANLKYCFLILLFVLLSMQATEAGFNPTSSDPADNDTSVGRNPIFTLNFAINVCDMAGAATVIRDYDNANIETIMSWIGWYGFGTQTITIPTSVTLDPNTAYHVDVGALAECGNSTNMLNSPYRIHFTTGICTGSADCACYNPPSCLGPCFGDDIKVKHFSPPDNGHFMQSYEGLGIVFNGNVSMGSGNIYIKKFSDDSTVETIDVTSNRVTGWGTPNVKIDPIGNLLDNGTEYYVNFDIEGYSLPADKNKWNFWTKTSPNTFAGSGL